MAIAADHKAVPKAAIPRASRERRFCTALLAERAPSLSEDPERAPTFAGLTAAPSSL